MTEGMNARGQGSEGLQGDDDTYRTVYKMSSTQVAEVYFFMREMCFFMWRELEEDPFATQQAAKYKEVLDMMYKCERIVIDRHRED